MYEKILVATDGSTLSKKAVRSAIELAGAVDAELVALYVVPRYPISYFEGGITVSNQDIARTEKQWADQGQAVVDAVHSSYVHAMHTGILVAVGFMLVAALVSALFVRSHVTEHGEVSDHAPPAAG